MAPPDIALHRRRLRRLRIAQALRLEIDVEEQQRSRDLLIQSLLTAVPASFKTDTGSDFASADDALVDQVVSVALAVLPETESDALSVLLLAAQILAQDGQFARLKQLNGRFTSLGQRVGLERPFLAAQLEAIGLVLNDRVGEASVRLHDLLGLSRRVLNRATLERSDDSLADILAATSLAVWLDAPAGDPKSYAAALEFLASARTAALTEGDGVLLANVEFIGAWARASFEADATRILAQSAPGFDAPPLNSFVRTRVPRTLLPPQITAIKAGALDVGNQLVALPTSSGKTLLAELKIASALTAAPGTRAVYVAPYRLLSRQVARTLGRGLARLGLRVADLGSGFDSEMAADTNLPDVAILTPERLDGILRLSESGEPGHDSASRLLASLSLLVFDELQLVGRPGRGTRFEMLLTRLRARHPELPFLGLCAATHGADELANWIGAPAPAAGARRPTGTLELLWQTDGRLIQRSGRGTASRVADIPRTGNASDAAARLGLRFDSSYHPILFVEPTRPLAEGSASRLHRFGVAEGQLWRDQLPASARIAVDEVVEEVHALLGPTHPMGQMLSVGVAYHHAGIPTHLLRLIEGLAERRLVRFFVATTTVAEGADLPFRVAILPHLNFQGSSGRLERDLYLNIIGRAGRANVAVEGLVVVLDSDARSLTNVVRGSLWSDTQVDRVRSALPNLTTEPATLTEYVEYRELQGQLLGWLAEGGPELSRSGGGTIQTTAEQVEEMVRRTFVSRSGDAREVAHVSTVVGQALSELSDAGLVQAASPYRLTAVGETTRMTGLSYVSALRLKQACTGTRGAWLADLRGVTVLDTVTADHLARTVLETEEVLKESIWLRRTASSDAAKLSVVRELAAGERDWPYGEEEYETDVSLIAAWLTGADYQTIGSIPRVYKAGLFGGSKDEDRSSDAAEQIGRLAYSASWAFGAVRLLAAEGTALPPWLRSAFELGMPSETACGLVRELGLTRTGASLLASQLPPQWDLGRPALMDIDRQSLEGVRLTALDRNRLKHETEK